jgi:glucose/mannose-6-phosphate isomerase
LVSVDPPQTIAYNGAMTTVASLDNDEIYARLDPEGLGGRIHALPEQIEEAWAAGRALALPAAYRDVDRVVVAGMGGSGIGGALLEALAVELRAPVPVHVVRDYGVPAYVDARTLVLASSASGNTEEAVSAHAAAVDAGAKCVVVTTGGRLLEVARAKGLPTLTYAWAHEPRAALGWSFASLLAVCGRAGVLPDLDGDMRDGLDEMRALRGDVWPGTPEAGNPAKRLARRLHGRLPAFVGAGPLVPVAYRWRTQVNENAKSWAVADELPEMDHNALAGFGLPSSVVQRIHAVILRHASMHPRVRLRVDATAEEMRAAGVTAEVAEISGASVLSQILRAVLLGDFASYYLGLLNGVHPSPVGPLERLKARLAREGG